MGVTGDEVRRIAALARLRLDDDDVDRLTGDLNGILAHVDALVAAAEATDAADAEEVEHGAESPVRPDVPDADPLLRPLAALAPEWRGGFFTVPRLEAMNADGGASE